MFYIQSLLFTLIYFTFVNWFQLKSFLKAFTNPKKRITHIEDRWITTTLKKKTGLTLKRITIFETDALFALMPATPIRPSMILSRGLYETFERDELEWIILHEAAHCVKWHTIKMTWAQIIILVCGISIIYWIQSSFLILTILLAIVASLISIQIMRLFEWEADKFSINRVDKPEAVISAQKKFRKFNKINEKSITRKFMYWNILPSDRIKLAKKNL